ncbi:response regulator transcription factor [Actinomadura macrotermitis]|uniref:HTH-type transcriptional regulator MalT n=1 Tax=Actinomadura macrotermitis TaxID=2585200 RepID=A0A7K0BV58_9ACTN|nr:response regulator transcription factor [Actinomadura macrotermitis]MQY05051.1 HTH-type transcriptional regulator MalT [Actinomadura macrotermitis]
MSPVTIVNDSPQLILVVVDDTSSPTESLIRTIMRAAPTSKILVLDADDCSRAQDRLAAAGAHAFLTKDAMIGGFVHTATDTPSRAPAMPDQEKVPPPDEFPLSPREEEVLGLVSTGLRNAEIAQRLRIAEGTVKRHLTSIYMKLHATSRLDAVNKAAALRVALGR